MAGRRLKKWERKLFAKERKHIRETTTRGLLREFKENRAFHRAQIAAGNPEPCFDCRFIAKKLGMEE